MGDKVYFKGDLTNYLGEIIKGIPLLRKPEYGTGEYWPDGSPKVNWSLIIDGDEFGFDVNHKEPNGEHRMDVELPKHTKLIRYGKENGKFTAPMGTAYEEISLPYVKESVYYHEYEVIADSITVQVIVTRGRVAPGFDYPGGGVQYRHPYTMIDSINRGLIMEIE